ncbi:MAG TPA: MSMEG_0570 family nitrogen starvation response protein [Rhodocyclaceae bacterium]|jgi:uncharacterized repeat protein (TIGR04042 family)|nr:MSMEG_0570 family nitrogen starvation response protein [Rhodocyclaceae bacterium]
MPEMFFRVRWPNGESEKCYSPSLVITDHLTPGTAYPVGDFVARCNTALTEASERVRQKYGYACSSAMDQLGRIQEKAGQFAELPEGQVVVEEFLSGQR